MLSSKSYRSVSIYGKDYRVGETLNDSYLNKLIKYIGTSKTLFVKEFDELNCVTIGSQCTIKTIKDAKPISVPPNKLTRKQNEMLCNKVSDLLKLGVIQHSYSEWESNAYVKEKSNGKLELRVNYSKLNDITEDMDYRSTILEESFMEFENPSVFSKLVFKDGFFQIPMHPKDKKKTAFKTELGKFEFNSMPYGLKNSEKHFLKTIDQVIGNERYVLVYFDQILIHTEDEESNLAILKRLFKKLREVGFKIDIDESCFCVDEVAFAGYLISKDGFSIDPEIANKIRTSQIPKCPAEVNSFLDLITPYSKFIRDFNILLEPIKKLIDKKIEFKWDSAAEKSFNQLIINFISRPQLGFFSERKENQIRIDVVPNGYTASLEQVNDDGNWKPIAYSSGSHSSDGNDYCTELERDSVLSAVKDFETYLSMNPAFTLVTKHSSFSFLDWLSPKDYFEESLLYFYISELEEYDIRHSTDPNSKHEIDINCFNGEEIPDEAFMRRARAFFSDSDEEQPHLYQVI